MRVLALSIASVLAVACGEAAGGSGGAADGADAAAADAALAAGGAQGWESVETVSNDGEVIVERVGYRSDGLLVHGRVCRPADGGRHGVAMYNHGGFSGLELDPTTATCEQTARLGYVWLGSTYRGEEGSEGDVEVCLGEVTDVLRMLDIALAQPYADPDHVVMWGGSHGGCVTLRALQRGAPVRAAAAIYPPADIGQVYRFWQARIANDDPQVDFYRQLSTIVSTATGGTPDTAAGAYAARSPLGFAAQLPATIPLLVVHGTADTIVPVAQSCALAADASLVSYHLDGSQQPTTAAPDGCATGGPTWSADAYPRPGWPGTRYFVAYDGLGHDVSGSVFDAMEQDVASFLLAKL
jgi:alpha/beta superfamily hydrolase